MKQLSGNNTSFHDRNNQDILIFWKWNKRWGKSELDAPTRPLVQEQEEILFAVIQLHSQVNKMLGAMRKRYRKFDEDNGSPVKRTRRKLVGWTEIKKEMSSKCFSRIGRQYRLYFRRII